MAEQKSDILQVGTNELELVDFRIFKEVGERVYEGIYGLNVSKVREIIKYPKLTELPGVPEYIEGIFDLRGIVIPVVNLAKWMGITPPLSMKITPRIIIAEFNNILIGFVVHDAKRIRRVSWNDIEPASFSSGQGVMDSSQITGVTRIENDEVLLILDLESIVQELGFYQPDIDTQGEIDRFEGYAMVLDDSATARKIVKEALSKMGFQVIDVKDGQEGIEKLEELYGQMGESIGRRLKIIVSDVEMPRMDGFHFSAKTKSDPRFKNIPIVFNSSISDHFSELRGKEAGGEGYLVKFDANHFYNEISRVIRAHLEPVS